MSASGVFTRRKRISFVEKTAAEVGDDTPFPMEATLDQIAEVWHRVKDAQFTAGSAADLTTQIDVPTTHPAHFAYQSNPSIGEAIELPDNWAYRGYQAVVESPGSDYGPSGYYPPFVNDVIYPALLTDEYDAGRGDLYRDADNERAILIPAVTGKVPQWAATNAFTYSGWNWNGISGFGDYPADTNLPNAFDATTPDPCRVDVVFTGQIAYVLDPPGSSFFSPTTKFYIGLTVDIAAGDSDNVRCVSPSLGGDTAGMNYVIRLASADLTCQLYVSADVTGADFIHEAVEWWPYAKTGGAVWQFDTGALL